MLLDKFGPKSIGNWVDHIHTQYTQLGTKKLHWFFSEKCSAKQDCQQILPQYI